MCLQLCRDKDKQSAMAAKKTGPQKIALPPPPELKQEKYIRPNITAKMKLCLDDHLQGLGFKGEDEMRAEIEAHNAKLREAKENNWTGKQLKKLRLEDNKLKNTCKKWKRCHRILREEYVRNTRCLVKSLTYDKRKKTFIALTEWEEEVVDLESQTSVPVVMRDTLPVKSKWVRQNIKENVYKYLKQLSRMTQGKFLPVPDVHLCLDTRQISHYKWSMVTNEDGQREGRWIVKYANSQETDILSDVALLKGGTLTEVSLQIAKAFAETKKGFIPIPPGNASAPRANRLATNLQIHFQQQGCQTCVYSSFASALWCLGVFDLAMAVASEAPASEGDPRSLCSLAVFVRNFSTWMTQKNQTSQ
jgi:hypothetical protein